VAEGGIPAPVEAHVSLLVLVSGLCHTLGAMVYCPPDTPPEPDLCFKGDTLEPRIKLRLLPLMSASRTSPSSRPLSDRRWRL